MINNKLYFEEIETIGNLENISYKKLKNKKILITGATGLICSFLVDLLMYRNQKFNDNIKIYLVSRNEARLKTRFSNYKLEEYSNANKVNLIYILQDICSPLNCNVNFDYIIHGASNTHPMQYSNDPVGTITTNVFGLYNLLEYAKNHNNKRLFLMSSVEVYGENKGDVEEFNELQKLAKEQNVDFQEVQKNAIVFVEDIKKQIEKYQIEVTDNYFEAMFNDYLNKKSSFTNQEKAEYLRILLYLSEIYNLNLRERLIEEKKDKKIVVNEKINCLLDNDEVLRTMLVQRYDNCYFDIKALYLKSDKLTAKNDKYDYLKMQADLTYRLYSIFVDKIENYAFDDLNSAYANLVK